MGASELVLRLRLLDVGNSQLAIQEGSSGVVVASVTLNPAVFSWTPVEQQILATALMEGLINNHFALSVIERKVSELGRH